MILQGYLSLTDRAGRCFEIMNAARTLFYVNKGMAHESWKKAPNDPRICWAFDENNYYDGPSSAVNPAPWYDSAVPASAEAFGFLPDVNGVQLEPDSSERLAGAPPGEPLRLTITGTSVASTVRGEQWWRRWAVATLRACDRFEADMFEHCPCEKDVPAPGVYTVQDALPPAAAAYLCDPAAPTLGAAPAVVDTVDDGFRRVLNVRFVSLDVDVDPAGMPLASGRRYTMVFEVRVAQTFTPPATVGTVGGLGTWNVCNSWPRKFSRCDDSAAPNPCDDPQVTVRRSVLPSNWIAPLNRMRQTLLTPPQASSISSAPVVTVGSGTAGVRNLRVLVHEAIEGVAAPDTVNGAKIYDRIAPLADARIVSLPANSTLVLDGRSGSATLRCAGTDRSGAHLVEGPAGSSWRMPPLVCDFRYWVTLDMSATEAARGNLDAAMTVAVSRRLS